jgi:hypothetical protein
MTKTKKAEGAGLKADTLCFIKQPIFCFSGSGLLNDLNHLEWDLDN